MNSLTLKVFQVVGYKNSGKTTAVCHLIKSLHDAGFKVATLKHHHHKEAHSLKNITTDTGKHRSSGADVTALASVTQTQIDFNKEPSIEAYVAFYKHLNIDVLLIEGFKNASYPKAVLLRSEQDYHSLKDLNNIMAFIISKEVPLSTKVSPLFYREDVLDFTTYIKTWLEGQT